MSNQITSPESVGLSSARLARVVPVMESYVTERGVVGISTMVARRGEIVHAEQFGFQDKEAGTPMAPDTIFRIYSMTKPVVSTALMLLHEEGAFQLEQPVAEYLPAFGATQVMADDGTLVDQARPMQIRDLLSHTSGLTYDFMADNPAAQLYRDARIMNDSTRPLGAVIDELATLPLAFQPGSRWHYSVGIDVAARLIEVLSGQSLGDFLKQRLFDPLGMSDTGFGVADDQLAPAVGDVRPPRPRRRELLGDRADRGRLQRLQRADRRVGHLSDRHPRGVRAWRHRSVLDRVRLPPVRADARERRASSTAWRRRAAREPNDAELMHSNHLPPELLPYELVGVPSRGGIRARLDGRCSTRADGRRSGSVGEYGWAGAAKTYFCVDPAEDLVGLFSAAHDRDAAART